MIDASSADTFSAPPAVSALTPQTVVRGISTLTIDGTGLDSATVTIGVISQVIGSNTPTQIVIDTVAAGTPVGGTEPVVITNANGSSVPVDLVVLERLQIVSATATSPWQVQVTFNRDVGGATVNPARFAITAPSLGVLAATSSGPVVTLTTNGQTAGTTYTVGTDALLLDTLGTPADGTTTTFNGSLPTEFVVARVGDPAGPALSASPAPVVLQRRLISTGALVGSPSPLTMPSASPGPYFMFSGSATGDGALSRSQDGKSLALYGYNLAAGVPLLNGVPRIVGVVDYNDFVIPSGVDISTLTGTAHQNIAPRGAVIDGNNLWLAGGENIIYLTTLGATGNPTNIASTGAATVSTRVIRIFGNTLYYSTGAGTPGIFQVGTEGTLPTGTGTAVTKIVDSTTPYAFTFFDLDPVEPGMDTLYVANDSLGVQRFRKTGGAWSATPTVTATPGVRHMACYRDGNDVVCLAVNTANVFKFRDVNAVNAISTSLTSATLAGTGTPANTGYRGLELAPVP